MHAHAHTYKLQMLISKTFMPLSLSPPIRETLMWTGGVSRSMS